MKGAKTLPLKNFKVHRHFNKPAVTIKARYYYVKEGVLYFMASDDIYDFEAMPVAAFNSWEYVE